LETDGYASRFKLNLTTAVLRYRTIDEFLDPDTIHFESLGIKPQLNFVVPTRWENVQFLPSMDLSLVHNFEIEQYLFAGGVTAALRYDDVKEKSRVLSTLSLSYGTRHELDGLNLSDYLRLRLLGQLRQNMKLKIGKHATTIAPFASISYFLDKLEFGIDDELTYKLDRQFEIGLIFSTLPRMRIWKIKIPELKISYVVGEDVSGIKIRM